MKGINRRGAAVVLGLVALTGAPGCWAYRDLVDPCYPQRYWHSSRQLTNNSFAPQVHNGRALDQTVWNYHFEAETDKLTLGGQQHLSALVRRRPQPDTTLYLQTAQDVAFDPDNPQKMALTRGDLDARRIAAVQKFLGAYTSGHTNFQVLVHDPAVAGISAATAGQAVQGMITSSQGTLGGARGSTGGGPSSGAAPAPAGP